MTTTSFPFLAIARQLGVPYGPICRLSSVIAGQNFPLGADQWDYDIMAYWLDDHGSLAAPI